MCLTPEWCLGGMDWPNVTPHEPKFETPLLLWANSTLGMVLFWWHGTRQQQGRSCITVTKIPGLSVLDPRALTDSQVDQCRAIFEEFRSKSFLPANEAYRDAMRKALDRELLFGVTSVLRFDPGLEEKLHLLRKSHLLTGASLRESMNGRSVHRHAADATNKFIRAQET